MSVYAAYGTPAQLVAKLSEVLKRQAPPPQQTTSTSTFSTFNKPAAQTQPTQQRPPLFTVQCVVSELMQICAQALGVPAYAEPLRYLFSYMQFGQSFIFQCFKQFLPTQTIQPTSYQQPASLYRADRNYIQCQLSKGLVFVCNLVVFSEAKCDILQHINNLIQQFQALPPCYYVVYDLCKCVALLQTLHSDSTAVIYLLSVPVLPFYTEQPTREMIVAELQQQQILVHFDKIKEEFFKKLPSIKELLNEQILPFYSAQAVQCPFGEYEKQNDRDESAKKMRIDPLMYHRLADGISSIICNIREQIGQDCGEQAIQFSYSLYNLNWLSECAEYELEIRLFCMVQALKFLYLIKNEYVIGNYADSLVDDAPYEQLYYRQYDFNEALIRTMTDKIITTMAEIQHATKTLNSFYENLIAPIVDGSSYDVRRHSVTRYGKEIQLDKQLLGIIFYIQTIQDVKFFLNLSLQSVDFTQPMVYRQQTVLQFMLQQALDALEINSAFGVDILYLLQAAMSHSQEYTRQFMSSNRTLKLQDIQLYIQHSQQYYGAQMHPKAFARMRQLCNRISNQDIQYYLATYNQIMQAPEYSYQAKLQVYAQLLDQLKQQQTGRKSQMQQVLTLQDPSLNQQQQLANLNQLAQLALQGRYIFLETREQPLVDTVILQLTPAQLFKALTDIIVKTAYDIPMTDVVFTFNGDFDVIYLAYLSNPKYFISYCLIRLNEFIKQVTNTTVQELLAASDVIVYDYSSIQQLKQVTVQSHTLWLELLCSPHVDIPIMQLLSELFSRFKEVGVNSFYQQLFMYKQVFNKFQTLMINNKIAATALLRVFEGLDHLLHNQEIEQFTYNFFRIFEYDLRNSSLVFKELNDAAALYYAQLFRYIQTYMRKDASLEVLFNILKFGKNSSVNAAIQGYFANLYNMLANGASNIALPLIYEQAKFLITVLTNAKQNVFYQPDSSILFDIYYYFFDDGLRALTQLLYKAPDAETRYIFCFLMIVMLEQASKANFDGRALEDCHILLQRTVSALFSLESGAVYAVEIEQKFLVLFHVLKENITKRRYQTLYCGQFSAAINAVAQLSSYRIFMIGLLTQLLEVHIFCHYHYETALDMAFADDVVTDELQEQSHVCIIAREAAQTLALALHQQQTLDSAALNVIVFLQMLANYCCISAARSHTLFHCIVEPLRNAPAGSDQYSQLLIARIAQLSERISLAGAAQSYQPESDTFMKQLARAVQQQTVSEAEMLNLSKLYSNIISGFKSDEQKLFLCSIDALGMSSQLVNQLYANAEKEVFEETLCGVLCQKILVYIYLNFYSARNGKLQLNLSQARSVVSVRREVLDAFRKRSDIVGRICAYLYNNQFSA